jgi:hypothetical protein
MKKPEEVMEILEAYDLTGSLRAAAALVGCDHKTVAYWVRMRDEAGGTPLVERKRPAMEAVFAAKVDELVDRSNGRIRADIAHDKLVALAIRGLSGRRGGGSPRRSGGGVSGTAGGPGRGSRSRGCGCSGMCATRRY